MPEQHDTPAEEHNTDTPAEEHNTGSGQASQPPSVDASKERQKHIDIGYRIGLERALTKLGLPTDLGEAIEAVRSLKDTSPPKREEQPSEGEGDIASNPKFVELAQQYSKRDREFKQLAKEREELQAQIESYKAQADVARVEKLKAAAMARGVGPGSQAEAFVRLYGDRVQFDDARDLVVLGKYPDGSMGPSGQPVEEFLDEVLAESRFLLAPEGRAGSGSQQKPVRSQTKDPDVENRDKLLESYGHGKRAASKADRIFNRLSGAEK